MDIDVWQLIAIFVGGVVAGIINTMAGGGTLIVFPLLVFLGVDEVVAVATNRLAITLQTLVATLTFRRGGVSNLKLATFLAIPATIASLGGAYIASSINKESFRVVLAILILMVLAIIVVDPKKRLERRGLVIRSSEVNLKRTLIGIFVFFLVGLYGGFFGAGVGIIMLTALFLIYDMDFLKGNGVKVVVNLFISIGATIMFAYKGKIDYMLAIPLAISNGLGAYIGASLSLKGGHKWIRRVVLAVGVISIIKLIFF